MAAPLKTVALLIANPALSSILSSTLAGSPSLRVRPFESMVALKTYMRLAPADLVVLDLDDAQASAEDIRQDRSIESRDLQIIALTSTLAAPSQPLAIDEIIAKPMSPRYLVERVLARIAKPRRVERRVRGLMKRDWSSFGDNVVPLFRPAPDAPLS
jgi:two-component system, OmpR family, phosphate regulon response regulator PhoB